MENKIEKKIVVLIPSHNAEKTIQRAIESVLVQTYANWQIYVIDDGSQDNTMGVVCNFLYDNERVVLVSLTKRKGKTYALRYCLDQVTDADYVMFLDSNDWIKDSNLFSKLIHEFAEEKADSICFNHEIVGKPGFQKLKKKMVMDNGREYVKNIMNRQFMDGNIRGGIYKFTIVKDVFVAQNYNHEDYINKFNILSKCSKVIILPIIGCVYSANPDEITHKVLRDNDKYYYIHAKEFADSICNKYPDLKVECQFFSNRVLLWTVTRLTESPDARGLEMYNSMMYIATKEIKVFLFNPYFSFKERISWILVQLRMYGYANRCYQRIQKR